MIPFKLDPAGNGDYAQNMNRAKDWFRQAENDYLFAGRFLALCCLNYDQDNLKIPYCSIHYLNYTEDIRSIV